MYENIVIKKAEEIKELLVHIRRDIHAHPEIGLNEIRTAGIIAERLEHYGIEVERNIGGTGVLGILRGEHPGKTILLRADMDCLRVSEENSVKYKSQYPNLMHACGHDAHVAWLIGAAAILSQLRDKIHGNIKFLFQPAEEKEGGAERVINSGVLENPKVDAVIGAHVWPSIPAGKIGIKAGSLMAATDNFKIIIQGKGGHGGQPHKCIDPIAVACEIYMALQTVISRKVDPLEPVVITIGKFNSGLAHNVIPDRAELEGTIRTLTHEVRAKIPSIMESIISGISLANRAEYEFKYMPYHAPVINDSEITSVVGRAASKVLGHKNVTIIDKPTMIGEDFSSFEEKVPGTFFWVGTYNAEKGITKPLHNPEFNIDEDIIYKSAAVFAESALVYLNEE
ncbi:M20 family metallopeptidase [Clostridium sp. DJ247]|uniref:M20 metallopeptidase family protein n=1 Tax=Clostridium sp. DJ247 TaxID=2726188 RepID=UPI0016272882|nr:amidohydrolase [Clostridium sp. DJ247]MBC2579737.1 amidohydrolase [Clostridium sp. DJ247]